mgnify:CR=1 FL=1
MAVDVSKFNVYAALNAAGPLVSKFNAYAVLNADGPLVSKANVYVVVKNSEQVRVSKETVYAVVTSRAQEQVSKFNLYAVLLEPDVEPVDVSKFVTYTVAVPRVEEQISKFNIYAVVFRIPQVSHPLSALEALHGGTGQVSLCDISAEVLTGGYPEVRLPVIAIDVTTGGYPEVRCPVICIEVLYGEKEQPVPVDPRFPAMNGGTPLGSRERLRGVGWSVFKKPEFNTKIAPHVSGHEVRAAFFQYPRYEFNLTYELLKDEINADESDLKTLMGFFLQRQGSYDEFCFEDPTDYYIEGQAIGVSDGGTVQYNMVRTYGGFTEPVGQVNLDALATFGEADVNVGNNTINIDSTSEYTTGYGPVAFSTAGTLPAGLDATKAYWVIVVDSQNIRVALSKADALAGTAVDITDDGTGTFTLSNSTAVYLDGVLQDLDTYEIVQNQLIFDAAPDEDDVITATFHFYFVCRFLDDMQEYENFMYQLWSINEVSFKSVLQEPVVA